MLRGRHIFQCSSELTHYLDDWYSDSVVITDFQYIKVKLIMKTNKNNSMLLSSIFGYILYLAFETKSSGGISNYSSLAPSLAHSRSIRSLTSTI